MSAPPSTTACSGSGRDIHRRYLRAAIEAEAEHTSDDGGRAGLGPELRTAIAIAMAPSRVVRQRTPFVALSVWLCALLVSGPSTSWIVPAVQAQPVFDACMRDAACPSDAGHWLRRSRAQVPHSCALQVSTSDNAPFHSLDCSHAVFTPVPKDFFRAQLRRAPETNDEACDELNESHDASGYILAVKRGTCSMLHKVKVAERAGALGVVVMDVSSNTTVLGRMRAPKIGRSEVVDAFPSIPAVMVSNATAFHMLHVLNVLEVPKKETNETAAAAVPMRSSPEPSVAEIELTIVSSYRASDPLAREIEAWRMLDEARSIPKAQDPTRSVEAAAYNLFGWSFQRLKWRDDAKRAIALAERMGEERREAILRANGAESKARWRALREASSGTAKPLERVQGAVHDRLVAKYPHVCEVGLNSGATALTFLEAGARSYTAFGRDRTQQVAATLEGLFPGVFTAHLSTNPAFDVMEFVATEPTCDLVYIDVYDSTLGAMLDAFEPLLRSNDHILIVQNTPCTSAKCKGPTEEWESRESSGKLISLHRAFYAPLGAPVRSMGFSVGKFVEIKSTERRKILATKPRGLSYGDMGDKPAKAPVTNSTATKATGGTVPGPAASDEKETDKGPQSHATVGSGDGHMAEKDQSGSTASEL